MPHRRPRTWQFTANPPYSRAIFHASWIVILLWAAWRRFSLPILPVADRDFQGYLNPALRALTGHPFQTMVGRAFLYPGLIYQLLFLTHDFRSIAILQHLLGLGGGLLMLATWCTACRSLPATRVHRWLYDVLGLAMFAFFLFTAQPVQFESLIRPDAVCPFFAALSYFLLARFLVAWRVEKKSGATFGFGAAAIFAAIVLAIFKPSFWLTAVFATIPVWWAVFDRREKLTRRLLMPALPLAAAWLFLFLPEKHFAQEDPRSVSFLPESLFSIHALIIREQLLADIATPDPQVPYTTEQLRSIIGPLDSCIAEARQVNPRQMVSIGYDADWLLYHNPFFEEISRANHWRSEAELQFCRYYYRRTWLKRPGAMLQKIVVQLGLFYNLQCPAYCDHGYQMEKYYRNADELLNAPRDLPTIDAWPPARAYRLAMAEVKDRETHIEMPRFMRVVTNLLGNGYFPLHLAWLATLPWIIWRSEYRRRFGVFAAILAVGYAFNFGNNLGIAVLHTLHISRYTYVQFGTTLLTEMLTGVYLIELLAAVISGVLSKDRDQKVEGALSPATSSVG